jgi:hypothetical protein
MSADIWFLLVCVLAFAAGMTAMYLLLTGMGR